MGDDWWDEESIQEVVAYCRDRTSPRKLRLFYAACCRRIWHLMPDERCRRAVEVAERLADGCADERERARAALEAGRVYIERGALTEVVADLPFWDAIELLDPPDAAVLGPAYEEACAAAPAVAEADAAAVYTACQAAGAAYAAISSTKDLNQESSTWAACAVAFLTMPNFNQAYASGGDPGEQAAQRRLLRDMFDNLRRPVRVAPTWLSWNNGTVPHLARSIYEERAFDRLPVLADALEEAGCDDGAILTHCRGTIEHVRGCWVLDLLLGKE